MQSCVFRYGLFSTRVCCTCLINIFRGPSLGLILSRLFDLDCHFDGCLRPIGSDRISGSGLAFQYLFPLACLNQRSDQAARFPRTEIGPVIFRLNIGQFQRRRARKTKNLKERWWVWPGCLMKTRKATGQRPQPRN